MIKRSLFSSRFPTRRPFAKRQFSTREGFAKAQWRARRLEAALVLPNDAGVARELIAVGASDAVINRLLPGRFSTEELDALRAVSRQVDKIRLDIGMTTTENTRSISL